jgi:hypothetical protein
MSWMNSTISSTSIKKKKTLLKLIMKRRTKAMRIVKRGRLIAKLIIDSL